VSESRRLRKPGARSPFAIRSPAPDTLSPERWHATAIVPIIRPLKTIM
jgi:hypothetical protein